MSSFQYNGETISKDQCFYCFETQFSADGVYISTKARKAFCLQHLIEFHLPNHQDDLIYLNLKKTPKPVTEKKEKMIKLEIKQQDESELFDINYKLVKIDASSHEIMELEINQQTEEQIKQLINANSQDTKQEIQAWQQEILPCEHTIEFVQTPIDNLDLTQCGFPGCGLTENLWICLTCGKLGCGREQFGGVKGNSHALNHFNTSNHPIAVKLGSLSKDVTDVYCYKCNDEISIPNIESLLQTFGINLNNFTKTEKNLIELQIEQNVNWEFNLESDSGEKLPSLWGAEFTGLKNLGNSCYISSVLQALFSIDAFRERFPYDHFKKFIKDEQSDNLEFELIKVNNGLNSGKFSQQTENEQYQTGILLNSFKSTIGKSNQEFNSMKQQDAFEFLSYLLDQIDNKVDKHLNNIFKFILIEKLNLPNNKIKLKSEVNENITLQLDFEVDLLDAEGKKIYKRENFTDLLKKFLSPEEIEFNSEMITKTPFFKTFPQYLITSVQRIQLENWIPIKTDVPINIPETFDLKDYQTKQVVKPNEEIVEDDEQDQQFEPNTSTLNNLIQMGFPEFRAKKAMFLSGSEDVETVMNWLIEHLEDPTVDDPIDFTVKKDGGNGGFQVDESKISSLQDMGFSFALAKKALFVNKNNVESSVEWLFSNPDDDGIIPEQEAEQAETKNIEDLLTNTTSSRYTLKAVVCHKGTQVNSGHYVAFVKKHGRWVLYNDEKVVDVTGDLKSWDEIEKNGYVYIWELA